MPKETVVVPPKSGGKISYPRVNVTEEQLASLYKGWRWNADRKRKQAIKEGVEESD